VRFSSDLVEPHVLDDGKEIFVRLLRPEDRDELARGFQQLSSASRLRRFLASPPSLNEAALRYLTEIDQVSHVAIVAGHVTPDMRREDGIGVARFVRLPDPPDTAEAAITVLDDWQHRGVGKVLLSALVEAALERGIRHFRAEVLGDNAPIRALLAEAGAVEQSREGSVIVYDVPLEKLRRPPELRPSWLGTLLRAAGDALSRRARGTPSAGR
jgi:GNAT superfamily N-acetyltransferase